MKTDPREWFFMLHEPDSEDLVAKMKSRGEYFKTLSDNDIKPTVVGSYDSGFYRGMQWALAKLEDK